MHLLVIRHARAENAQDFAKTGAPDDLRPLTEEGRERMRAGLAGLRRMGTEIDVLATSPLVRARQTAEIVAVELDTPAIVELDQLRPDAPPHALGDWLRGAGQKETFAVVGHRPHLGELVGWLLTGRPKSIVEIKKGGAVMLEVRARGTRAPRPGKARLRWSLTPRQLRQLAG